MARRRASRKGLSVSCDPTAFLFPTGAPMTQPSELTRKTKILEILALLRRLFAFGGPGHGWLLYVIVENYSRHTRKNKPMLPNPLNIKFGFIRRHRSKPFPVASSALLFDNLPHALPSQMKFVCNFFLQVAPLITRFAICMSFLLEFSHMDGECQNKKARIGGGRTVRNSRRRNRVWGQLSRCDALNGRMTELSPPTRGLAAPHTAGD